MFRCEHDEQGRIARVMPGPVSRRLVAGLHRAAAAQAVAGFDVVMDHVLLEAAWVRDLQTAMTGLDLTLVGVRCGEAVLSQQEALRRNGGVTGGIAEACVPRSEESDAVTP